MSPKTYMRIIRLQTILQLITQQPELNLSQLSYLGGYADQAHFIRDFKKLTGITFCLYNRATEFPGHLISQNFLIIQSPRVLTLDFFFVGFVQFF